MFFASARRWFSSTGHWFLPTRSSSWNQMTYAPLCMPVKLLPSAQERCWELHQELLPLRRGATDGLASASSVDGIYTLCFLLYTIRTSLIGVLYPRMNRKAYWIWKLHHLHPFVKCLSSWIINLRLEVWSFCTWILLFLLQTLNTCKSNSFPQLVSNVFFCQDSRSLFA